MSETELWAIAPGSSEADIVVRDRRTLDLLQPSPGTATFNRWWFQGGQIDPELPVTTAVSYTADGGANATIAGAHHVFLGSSMATWEPGDNFVQGGEILCE